MPPTAEKSVGFIVIRSFIEAGILALTSIASWEGLGALGEWISRSWDEEAWLERRIEELEADLVRHSEALAGLRSTREAAEARLGEVEAELDGRKHLAALLGELQH